MIFSVASVVVVVVVAVVVVVVVKIDLSDQLSRDKVTSPLLASVRVSAYLKYP